MLAMGAGNVPQTRIRKGYDCFLMMLDSHASHERSEIRVVNSAVCKRFSYCNILEILVGHMDEVVGKLCAGI